MCCKSVFGYCVHSLGANLHLNPFVLWPEHGYVQAFVAVAFGYAQPVAQAFGVGLVHVGYNTVNLPALQFLLVLGAVEDYAYCEKVVNTLEGAVLLLHFLPDGVYAFRAPLDVEFKFCFGQPFVYRFYEVFDICVAGTLGSVELLTNHIICVVLEVLYSEVFQFAFNFVKP